MADRYWVGGTGSWNSTAKWSTTSGGASGASVPTASDNAIFDANSATGNAYVVTIQASQTCADLTYTPFAGDGVTQFSIIGTFVIAGTFSTSGTQGNRRLWLYSSTESLMRDVSIATIGTVTDVDFRDIRITGAGGTLTGTRIGDLKGNVGITFSTPKNCFRIGTGNWSDDQWSATSGGSVSTDFFPLAQDTAVFDENTSSGTHTMNSAVPYMGTLDMSGRTSVMQLAPTQAFSVYGDWINGSGVDVNGGVGVTTFSGRNTQTITSAGKTFSQSLVVNSYGGTVELADALNIATSLLTVTNGTFDTKGYNVTAASLVSSNSNVREIKLGASTVTLSNDVTFTTSTNLTFDAGTSSIVQTAQGPNFNGGNQTFYDVSFTSIAGGTHTINQSNTFNSLSITAPSAGAPRQVPLGGDQTITGTLTVAGASAARRIFLRSSTVGTPRTLTVGTLSADDCDFRDITIAGTAAGGSPTRAGDCGGNSGVTFPAGKTVYWNLAGTQNWYSTAWATTSGGTPALNNFPLAQDTAVFDNTGAAGIVIMQGFNIGNVDMSARTSAMTLMIISNKPIVYGNWLFGTGVTSTSGAGVVTFAGSSTSTITSNGVAFGTAITIDCATGTVQLADALEIGSTRTFKLTSGTFDAVSYNVTIGLFSCSSNVAAGQTKSLKMGSGLWTITGTGTVWNLDQSTFSTGIFDKGTADILLSDTSTAARTFLGNGSGSIYNKLTIGGATGTSTLTISGNSHFTELASTKTVAHTINLGTLTQTFGKWSVTGTSGNVVTLTGTGTNHQLVGACTDGIDYLAMGSIRFSANSPAEFYAGANSTATGSPAAPTYLTAKPADSTRYWVGGTGNWNDTARWSTSSGGASGADLPRSHDDVVFDSSSNATAYTVTVGAITGGNRCKALTIAGPASGNVTLGGSAALFIHDDITLPATGLTRTYTGAITLSGTGAGKTITTNGVTLSTGVLTLNGVGAEWSLGDALTMGQTSSTFNVFNGSFDTANYNLTVAAFSCNVTGGRSITLGSSTVTLGTNASISFGSTESITANLTFNVGTSQINCTSPNPSFAGNGQTFYNVSFTSTALNNGSINGANTFNNLSVAGRTSEGVGALSLAADQTINGTLTLSAGTNAAMRTFVRSNTIGTTRTLTCAAVASLTDIDFRDITIAGAAAPVSGTRLGDCKGNSGITFVAGADKYWGVLGNGSWSATVWATSSGGAVSNDNFPLAQDTIIFEAGSPNSGNTATINAAYNIGTIDMSARTTNTMALACSQSPSIYGNWTNGTGVTLSGTGTLTFAGRGSQTITSAGRTFTQLFTIDTPGGSVTLQDAFETNSNSAFALDLQSGTLDANNYNVTVSGSVASFRSTNSNTRTVAIGSGTWTMAGSGTPWNTQTITGLTVTGTGTLSFTSASTKTFSIGTNTSSFSGLTINQGGAGQLNLNGNNSFANITKTYTGATTISFATTTQRVADFTATGTAGNVLTIQGSSATSPCTLIHTGAGEIYLNYLNLVGVRAYTLTDTTWTANISTNNGTFGWLFDDTPTSTGNFFLLFG
jgi:fibronectin-binding autotransporter adhesin